MKWIVAAATTFLLFAALPVRAQSPDQGSTPNSTAKPADAPPAPSSPATPPPEKKKPKKIWTNDEIGSVKGGVSVVGDGASASSKSSTPTSNADSGAADARQTMVENYRNQIQNYQAQIDSIDKRIAQLKNFKGENSSSSAGIKMYQGYDMVPLEDQVKQLEEKKKQLQAKIEDTENEARKHGVESGELR